MFWWLPRARRQWEAKDKQELDKIVAARSDSMKKQVNCLLYETSSGAPYQFMIVSVQIADGIGPKLDAMVLSNKQRLNARKDEIELELIQLKKDLAIEFEVELKKFRDQQTQEYQVGAACLILERCLLDVASVVCAQQELDKVSSSLNRQISELRQRHAEELKEKRDKIARRIQQEEDQYDKIRMLEAETVMQVRETFIILTIRNYGLCCVCMADNTRFIGERGRDDRRINAQDAS
jgi:hypothetical protein